MCRDSVLEVIYVAFGGAKLGGSPFEVMLWRRPGGRASLISYSAFQRWLSERREEMPSVISDDFPESAPGASFRSISSSQRRPAALLSIIFRNQNAFKKSVSQMKSVCRLRMASLVARIVSDRRRKYLSIRRETKRSAP